MCYAGIFLSIFRKVTQLSNIEEEYLLIFDTNPRLIERYELPHKPAYCLIQAHGDAAPLLQRQQKSKLWRKIMNAAVSTQKQESYNAKVGYPILFVKNSFVNSSIFHPLKDVRDFDDVEDSLYRPRYILRDRETPESMGGKLASWHLALDVLRNFLQQPLDRFAHLGYYSTSAIRRIQYFQWEGL